MFKHTLALLTLVMLTAPASFSPAVADVPTTHPCDPIACPPPVIPGGPGGGPENHPTGSFLSSELPLIACRVSGDPVALPDDLKFRNIGSIDIPAGTRVYWLVKATGDHGYYFLTADLKPGKELAAADMLSVGTPPKDNCRSMIM
jgi:hypothetical protein